MYQGQIGRRLSNTPGEYPANLPKGIYDNQIVCENCERLFSSWDSYAEKFLLKDTAGTQPIMSGQETIAYRIDEFDYAKLKLFFISLLWRASASNNAFISKINAAPFGERLKRHIQNADPGSPDDFSVVLAKFDEDLGKAMLDPHSERFDGVNYYRFYLTRYVAYIKVDQWKTPDDLRTFQLHPGSPLYLIARQLRRSKEFNLILDIVRLNKT